MNIALKGRFIRKGVQPLDGGNGGREWKKGLVGISTILNLLMKRSYWATGNEEISKYHFDRFGKTIDEMVMKLR